MKRIEIVTHSYQYATLLRCQLSSLVKVHLPPGIELIVTVYFTNDDLETSLVLDFFRVYKPVGVTWNFCQMPVLELCRRSIGRNQAALRTQADWVWFCDADYWFETKCWIALAGLTDIQGDLIFPKAVFTCLDAVGDVLVEQQRDAQGLIELDRRHFVARAMNRAIGGIQIVKGDRCRKDGYLPDHPKAQAATKRRVFERNFADVWFRNAIGSPGIPMPVPGVFRIGHSKKGRYDPTLKL